MRIAPIDVELVEEARSLRVLLEKQSRECAVKWQPKRYKMAAGKCRTAGILYGKFPAGNGNAVR